MRRSPTARPTATTTPSSESVRAARHFVRTADALSCENVTPSPYRIYVLDVVDHVCEELLDQTFSSGPVSGPSDGSIITWTCSTGDMPVAVTDSY